MYVIGKFKKKIKFNGFSINGIPIEHTVTKLHKINTNKHTNKKSIMEHIFFIKFNYNLDKYHEWQSKEV